MQLECNGDATSDVVFQTLAGEMEFDYSDFGGLKNTEASGFTGDVNVVLPQLAPQEIQVQSFVNGLKFTNRRSLNG